MTQSKEGTGRILAMVSAARFGARPDDGPASFGRAGPARQARGAGRGGPLVPRRPALQRRGDLRPFLLEGSVGAAPARPAVPVIGVRQVAFAPMQVGVHPGAVGAADILREPVRAVPV